MHNAHPHFHSVLEAAASRLSSSLERFEAWHKDEGITERNLSFHTAAAFLAVEPDASVVLEVPFSAGDSGRADNHLDAYLFSPNIGYMVECKQLYSREKLTSLVQDARRLDQRLLASVLARHRGPVPVHVHPVVLADAWRLQIERWWVAGSDPACLWPREELPAGWAYGSLTVRELNPGPLGTLFWLYAVGPALSVSSRSV